MVLRLAVVLALALSMLLSSNLHVGAALYAKPQHGRCVDANNKLLSSIWKADLGADYIKICREMCTSIGPRCMGFWVRHEKKSSNNACYVVGAAWTPSDTPGGWSGCKKASGCKSGSFFIARANGNNDYSCYQKANAEGRCYAPTSPKKSVKINNVQRFTNYGLCSCLSRVPHCLVSPPHTPYTGLVTSATHPLHGYWHISVAAVIKGAHPQSNAMLVVFAVWVIAEAASYKSNPKPYKSLDMQTGQQSGYCRLVPSTVLVTCVHHV